jgi:hypothetical protein
MNKIEQASKMTNVTIEPRIELLESILEPWTIAVGQDLEGYKNHCYRMIHFTQALYPCSEEEKSKVNSYNSSQRASDAYRGNSYYGSGYANSSGDGRLSRSDYASLPDYNSSGSSQYYNRDGWKKTGFDSDNS